MTLRVAALIDEPVDIELLQEALSVLEASEIALAHARSATRRKLSGTH